MNYITPSSADVLVWIRDESMRPDNFHRSGRYLHSFFGAVTHKPLTHTHLLPSKSIPSPSPLSESSEGGGRLF